MLLLEEPALLYSADDPKHRMMERRSALLAMMVIILAIAAIAIIYQYNRTQEAPTKDMQQIGCTTLILEKRIYEQGEPIKIILKNECPHPILLKNSAPWKIVKESGGEVYTPIALQVITEIKPNESKTWVWNQRDNSGKQVEPGAYQVILETINSGTLTQSFTIA